LNKHLLYTKTAPIKTLHLILKKPSVVTYFSDSRVDRKWRHDSADCWPGCFEYSMCVQSIHYWRARNSAAGCPFVRSI